MQIKKGPLFENRVLVAEKIYPFFEKRVFHSENIPFLPLRAYTRSLSKKTIFSRVFLKESGLPQNIECRPWDNKLTWNHW